MPPEIVPSTLKRTTRSDTARPRAAPRSEGPRSGEDRQAYRRAPGTSSDKKADVGAGAGDIELVSIYLFLYRRLLFTIDYSVYSAEDSVVAHVPNKFMDIHLKVSIKLC